MIIESDKLKTIFRNIEVFTKGYKGIKLINIRVKDRVILFQINIGKSTLSQTIEIDESVETVSTVIKDNSYSKLFEDSKITELIVLEKILTMRTETMSVIVENLYNEVYIKSYNDISENYPLHDIAFNNINAFKSISKDYATLVEVKNNKMKLISSVALLSKDVNYTGIEIQLSLHNFKLLKEFYEQLTAIQMNEDTYKFIGNNIEFVCQRQKVEDIKLDKNKIVKICEYQVDINKLKVLSQFKVDIINLLINSYYLRFESITEMTFEQQTDILNYSVKTPLIKLKINLRYLIDALNQVNNQLVTLSIYDDAYLLINEDILLPVVMC